MKKVLFILTAFSILHFSCGNSASDEKKTSGQKETLADSLENQVMDGHDVGMRKYKDLKNSKYRAEQMLDSISRLPASEQQAAGLMKTRLQSIILDLSDAKDAMDKWMDEYNHDSATDNLEARIKYLEGEKVKVEKVKDAILNSLARADSVLKVKG
jgi:hypothetical protein